MSAALSVSSASVSGHWLCEHNCGRPGTDRCGGCKLYWYCSPACQKDDWKRQHRHVCAAHKRAVAEDPEFASWSPALRLEWLATRAVLATYVGAVDASPFASSHFGTTSPLTPDMSAAVAAAAILPPAQWSELPRIACRWFTQAARFSSLGLRDASAYLDWTWDSEHISPATRIAALAAQWVHVWRPALQTARHQGRLFQQLVILRSFDFARFVVAVNAPTSLPNSTEPAPPTGSLLPPAVAAPNASWLIRGPDTCWFTDCTQEARLCYSQFYAELCEELQCVALSLTQPSWAAQVTYRLDHQEWVRRQNAKNGTSDADAELDSNIDPEIAALSALTAAPITWCPISAGSATVLSVLPFFAFTAALNAVAATDHLPSLHLVNEILLRRGYFPRSPLHVTFDGADRLDALQPLWTVILSRFVDDIRLRHTEPSLALTSIASICRASLFRAPTKAVAKPVSLLFSKSVQRIRLEIIELAEEAMLISEVDCTDKMAVCERSGRSAAAAAAAASQAPVSDPPTGLPAAEVHSCRWCGFEFDVPLLSRLLFGHLMLLRWGLQTHFWISVQESQPIHTVAKDATGVVGTDSIIDAWTTLKSTGTAASAEPNYALSPAMVLAEFKKLSARLTHFAMQSGRAALSRLTPSSSTATEPSSNQITSLAATDEAASFSLVFCHFLLVHQRAHQPHFDIGAPTPAPSATVPTPSSPSSLWFTCARAALLTRYSYHALFELAIVLASPCASLLAANFRLADSSRARLAAPVHWDTSNASSTANVGATDADSSQQRQQAPVQRGKVLSLPPWVQAPADYQGTVLRMDTQLVEAARWLFPLPPLPIGVSDDPSSATASLPDSAGNPRFDAALHRYSFALQWARRAAHHVEAGAEIFEILVPLLTDLIHADSCPSNDQRARAASDQKQSEASSDEDGEKDVWLSVGCVASHEGQSKFCALVGNGVSAEPPAGSDAESEVPGVAGYHFRRMSRVLMLPHLPITACACTLAPLAPGRQTDSTNPLQCNVADCYRAVLHFLFGAAPLHKLLPASAPESVDSAAATSTAPPAEVADGTITVGTDARAPAPAESNNSHSAVFSFSVMSSFSDLINALPAASPVSHSPVLRSPVVLRDQPWHALCNLLAHGLRSIQLNTLSAATVSSPTALYSSLPLRITLSQANNSFPLQTVAPSALSPLLRLSVSNTALLQPSEQVSASTAGSSSLPALAIGYANGLHRFALGEEFHWDSCAIAAQATLSLATAANSKPDAAPASIAISEAFSSVPHSLARFAGGESPFLQLLALAPGALLSASPSSLDVLFRFGWALLFERRWRALGRVRYLSDQVPSFTLLAIRCLLLPALLRPHASAASALAELIQQHLLPLSPEVTAALEHDVGLLRVQRGLCVRPSLAPGALTAMNVFARGAPLYGSTLLATAIQSAVVDDPKVDVESIQKRLSELTPDNSSVFSSVLADAGHDTLIPTALVPAFLLSGIRTQLLCILTELSRLVAMHAAGTLPSLLASAASQKIPDYPSYNDASSLVVLPLAAALAEHADRTLGMHIPRAHPSVLVAPVSNASQASARQRRSRELWQRCAEDLDDIQMAVASKLSRAAQAASMLALKAGSSEAELLDEIKDLLDTEDEVFDDDSFDDEEDDEDDDGDSSDEGASGDRFSMRMLTRGGNYGDDPDDVDDDIAPMPAEISLPTQMVEANPATPAPVVATAPSGSSAANKKKKSKKKKQKAAARLDDPDEDVAAEDACEGQQRKDYEQSSDEDELGKLPGSVPRESPPSLASSVLESSPAADLVSVNAKSAFEKFHAERPAIEALPNPIPIALPQVLHPQLAEDSDNDIDQIDGAAEFPKLARSVQLLRARAKEQRSALRRYHAWLDAYQTEFKALDNERQSLDSRVAAVEAEQAALERIRGMVVTTEAAVAEQSACWQRLQSGLQESSGNHANYEGALQTRLKKLQQREKAAVSALQKAHAESARLLEECAVGVEAVRRERQAAQQEQQRFDAQQRAAATTANVAEEATRKVLESARQLNEGAANAQEHARKLGDQIKQINATVEKREEAAKAADNMRSERLRAALESRRARTDAELQAAIDAELAEHQRWQSEHQASMALLRSTGDVVVARESELLQRASIAQIIRGMRAAESTGAAVPLNIQVPGISELDPISSAATAAPASTLSALSLPVDRADIGAAATSAQSAALLRELAETVMLESRRTDTERRALESERAAITALLMREWTSSPAL